MSRKRTGARRGNGEGSIQKRRDGRWCARVSLAQGRLSLYGATRQEVADKLTDALKAVRDGAEMPPARLTFGHYIASWLESVRPTLRDRTHQRYSELLRLHALPSFGGLRLSAVSPSALQKLYAQKITAGLAPATVGQLHRVMHHALGQAASWGLIPRNPVALVRPPSVRREEMRVLTGDQLAALLRAAADDRLSAVYVLAAYTGMRQGEIFGLRWSDVDIDRDGLLRVRKSLQWIRQADGHREWRLMDPKTKASQREIPLENAVVAALRQHRARQAEESLALGPAWQQTGLVFTDEAGGPIVASNFTRHAFAKALRRADLPAITFHALRHSAASLMLNSGVPIPQVAAALGHASPAVTMAVYAHAIPGQGRRATAAMAAVIASATAAAG